MINKEFAPIIIFAFNRLDSLKACVASLQKNTGAADSDLIVYVDGPRVNRVGETEKVAAIRDYVKNIKGFKSLETHFSETNKGLGPSLIVGITDVINRYGHAIIVEDDIICSNNFLAFLNQGLELYQEKKNVYSISGETVKIKVPNNYEYDNYFAPRAGCWGWATWADRWNKVDWELDDWNAVIKNKRKFNKWGGSDCFKLLDGWHTGKNKSWAIRFNYSQFINNATSVFPIISKVSNEGFNEDGTNCDAVRYNRFAMKADKTGKKEFCFKQTIEEEPYFVRQRLFPVRLFIRIFAKLVNI